jgi:hypothetical protein
MVFFSLLKRKKNGKKNKTFEKTQTNINQLLSEIKKKLKLHKKIVDLFILHKKQHFFYLYIIIFFFKVVTK